MAKQLEELTAITHAQRAELTSAQTELASIRAGRGPTSLAPRVSDPGFWSRPELYAHGLTNEWAFNEMVRGALESVKDASSKERAMVKAASQMLRPLTMDTTARDKPASLEAYVAWRNLVASLKWSSASVKPPRRFEDMMDQLGGTAYGPDLNRAEADLIRRERRGESTG